jgi:hypothetical protein
MGAWGPGNFENDAVNDWLADLSDWQDVSDALSKIVNALPGEYVGADACCVALGAAEVVAASMGRPDRLPAHAKERMAAMRGSCDQTTRAIAETCARMIESSSELQALFDEAGRHEEWHAIVHDLIHRLSTAG